MNFRLWGKGAQQPKPGATDDNEKDEDAKKKAVEKDDDDEGGEDDEDKAKAKDDDDEDEEKDEAKAAHDAAVAASASIPAAARQAVVFLERERIHAIVEAGGRDRVGQALHVALNSDMTAKQAIGFLEATGPDHNGPASANAGRIGLRGDMATRRTPKLGADRAGDDSRSADAREIEDAAASVLAFVPGAARKS
ncbi:MAG: hypothetical protein KIS73_24740 [Enhydrobacter sp.]|nr:hypothetical protein [Enhydrobacter sp.]